MIALPETPPAIDKQPTPLTVTDAIRVETHDDLLYQVVKAEERFRRNAEFDAWVTEVRDPAQKANEGVRMIRTKNKKADASYEIALLPDGRYAISWHLSYHTGDCHGSSTPWTAYATREECLDAFLAAAQRHFGPPPGLSKSEWEDDVADGYRSQREAQKQMLSLLEGEGLFGFMEPPVDQERTKWLAEIRADL